MYLNKKIYQNYSTNDCSDERDQINYEIEDIIEYLILYFAHKRLHIIIQTNIKLIFCLFI